MTTTPAWAVMFSSDQCRVLRQVRAYAPECHAHVTERALAANYSTPARTTAAPPGAVGSAPDTSAPGRSHPGAPSGDLSGGSAADAGGSAPSSSTPGSGASSPGGTPGNPGGGAPGDTLNPIHPPPQKPDIDLSRIAKIRGEIRDAARQRVINRIVFGNKPPDTDTGKPPSRPGKPGLGAGGLRGQASPKSSSGAAWSGQAR
jgi:hypothetical protein